MRPTLTKKIGLTLFLPFVVSLGGALVASQQGRMFLILCLIAAVNLAIFFAGLFSIHRLMAEGVERQTDDLKRALEETQKLGSVVENSYDGVIITKATRDQTILYVNPGWERTTGWTREEVVGKLSPRILKSDRQEETFYRELWKTILGGNTFKAEIINKRKDGSLYDSDITVFQIVTAAGETLCAEVCRDITERKRTDAALRQKSRDLIDVQEKLFQAQKMEAIGRLSGGIAHDFNNLLGIINGYSELTLSGLKDDDPLRENLKEIQEAGERAAALTRQLLAFSRRQVLQSKVINLNEVIGRTERMLRRLIGEDINLATFSEPGLGQVKADPGQIEQVIMNLAVNSRDAMPEGGKLTIETRNVVLDRTGSDWAPDVAEGRYVVMSVSDTGKGIDAETKEHIFEPFFTTKEKGKGTGLGLSTVYGIVKQSGGHVTVYSEPGHGTSVKVYLPQVDEEAESSISPNIPTTSLEGSETILVVEDEDRLRNLVCRILKGKGYTVLRAPSGKDALKISRSHGGPIPLLLTDVIMPGLSGRETAKTLTSQRPEMKILYMSGYTDDAIVRHGVLEKGVHFLPKPFSPEALARKVREVLEHK